MQEKAVCLSGGDTQRDIWTPLSFRKMCIITPRLSFFPPRHQSEDSPTHSQLIASGSSPAPAAAWRSAVCESALMTFTLLVFRFNVSCTKRISMLRAGRWGQRPMGRRGRPPSRVNGVSREHFLRQVSRCHWPVANGWTLQSCRDHWSSLHQTAAKLFSSLDLRHFKWLREDKEWKNTTVPV